MMKDPLSNWKGGRGAAKRLLSRPRLFKHGEFVDTPADSSVPGKIKDQEAQTTRPRQEESPVNQKFRKRNVRGLFGFFGGAIRSSSANKAVRLVAADEGEAYWNFETHHADEDREDCVPSSNIPEHELHGQDHHVQTTWSYENQEEKGELEASSSPCPAGVEELDVAETTSSDSEEDFVLPEGFIGKFRGDTEPLFSYIHHMDSGLTTIPEEDTEQSSLTLNSSTLTSIRSSTSAEEDNSTKWINLLHKNVVYETKSMERNVEVTVDRENPVGASLKIRLQRERSAEKSMHDEPYDKKWDHDLYEQIDEALARLEYDGPNSILVGSTGSKKKSQRNSVPERLNNDLCGTIEEIIGEALSYTSPIEKHEIYNMGEPSALAAGSDTKNDADAVSVASSSETTASLEARIEKLLRNNPKHIVATEENETRSVVTSETSRGSNANVETQQRIQSLTVPLAADIKSACKSVANGTDQGEFQLNHPESMEMDIHSIDSRSHEANKSEGTSVASEKTATSKHIQTDHSGSTATASTTTPELNILQSHMDDKKEILWIAVKPTLSLDTAKPEESFSKTAENKEGRKKKRSRWSTQRRLPPWLKKKDSSISSIKGKETPYRDGEITSTRNGKMHEEYCAVSFPSTNSLTVYVYRAFTKLVTSITMTMLLTY
eukprot:scaffold804_cov165-Amphora_coffeaeformis.AAC.10